MNVKKYKAKVESIINPVDNIYTVEFRSLCGKFRYLPGQFLHLALEEYDPSGGWPESRCFSFQSSPASEFIKITFSVKGNFTNRMAEELTTGKIIDLKLPYGELFQKEHSKDKAVFIAGGTGITPFLSLFNDKSFSEYRNPKLYLGVRGRCYNIYEEDLALALQINHSLVVKIKYQDEEGVLDVDNIFNENSINSTYFISGPKLMIYSFKTRLTALGLNEYYVMTDDWE